MITSRSNPAIKRIRALRSRKEREATGLFFVEGIRIVGEGVESEAGIESVVVAPDLLSSEYGKELVARLGDQAPVLEVSADVFGSLSTKEGPQGLGAVVRQRWETLASINPAGDLCWVALDAVQDPGNLGTILRTSDAVGGSGIILLGQTSDPYDASALRASMGAIFSQRLARAGFDELVAWAHAHGCTLLGTSDAARTDYLDVRYEPPVVLLMGSEQKGLSAEQQAACDTVVRIPMVGHSDSLNLAVATGVMLYALFNERRRR